jgi:hypothetical protein
MFTRPTARAQWPHRDNPGWKKGTGPEVPLIGLWSLPPNGKKGAKRFFSTVASQLDVWPSSHGDTGNDEVDAKWEERVEWESYEELMEAGRVTVQLRPGDLYLGKESLVHRGTPRVAAACNPNPLFGLSRVHFFGDSPESRSDTKYQAWVQVEGHAYEYDPNWHAAGQASEGDGSDSESDSL